MMRIPPLREAAPALEDRMWRRSRAFAGQDGGGNVGADDFVWRGCTDSGVSRFEFGGGARDDNGDSYWHEFWDGPGNAVAVGFAAGGLGLGTVLAAAAGEFSLMTSIPYGFGLGRAIWLPMNWSRWKRGLW